MNKAFSRFTILSFVICLFFLLYFCQMNHRLRHDLKNDSQIMDELRGEIASLNEKISAKQNELSVLSETERGDELALWKKRLEYLKEAMK